MRITNGIVACRAASGATFAVTLAATLAFAAPAHANLLANAGFEESAVGHHDVLDVGWDTWAGRNLSVVDAITGPVYEGSQALMFDKSTANGGRELRQSITGLSGGETYTFSVQLNVQDLRLKKKATDAGFHVALYDGDTGALLDRHVQATTTAGWQKVMFDVIAPSSGSFTLVAGVADTTSALVYFDAVSMAVAGGGGATAGGSGQGTQIPEPAVLALITLGGMAVVGGRSYRRAA